jgi:folate-dependent phosphoribosylglycinamide formyltransferase PurN
MLKNRPRVALLCSRRCPGLEHLLAGHRRRDFDLVGVLVSDGGLVSDAGLPVRGGLSEARVAVLDHPIRSFYGGRPISDLARRREFDERSVALLAPHRPDFVLLSSYLYLLTEPMLEAFPGRIANVHGSDLLRKGTGGRPRYPGLRAVRDAITAGEAETRATAHVVTERLDDGPVLVRSRPFPVPPFVTELRRRGLVHAVHAYAFAHQEWMLATAWGPLLTDSIALLSGQTRPERDRWRETPAAVSVRAAAAGGRA